MNSALQGVSSLDLADTFLCSCLFGIQMDDPKPRQVLLHPAEDSKPCLAHHVPLTPSGWGAWEAPPGGLGHVSGNPLGPSCLPRSGAQQWKGPRRWCCSNHLSRTLSGMERPAPAHTPVHGVEQDLDHEQNHSWPHVPWLSLSRAMVESRELPAVPRHQGEVVAVPSSPTMPGWPEQGYDVVTAEGSSQRGRNVLLHEREEITA